MSSAVLSSENLPILEIPNPAQVVSYRAFVWVGTLVANLTTAVARMPSSEASFTTMALLDRPFALLAAKRLAASSSRASGRSKSLSVKLGFLRVSNGIGTWETRRTEICEKNVKTNFQQSN